jgi:hypothetical protein
MATNAGWSITGSLNTTHQSPTATLLANGVMSHFFLFWEHSIEQSSRVPLPISASPDMFGHHAQLWMRLSDSKKIQRA